MTMSRSTLLPVALALICTPAFAMVTVKLASKPGQPQLIGTAITWTATGTDTGAGPLTFQFSVLSPGNGSLSVFKDFNVGTVNVGTWTAQPFVWVPTGIQGTYQVKVVAKDFVSGESASMMVPFMVKPLTGLPVAVATANPLVALFSAPSCTAGSFMRVSFQDTAKKQPATVTNWVACHPPSTMAFEIAGMYPSTAYTMLSETDTGGTITYGTPVTFTTGALPANINFPIFKVQIPAGPGTDADAPVILATSVSYISGVPPPVATDLSGTIIWYYNSGRRSVFTRPLTNGGMLTIQDGIAWNPNTTSQQTIRQIDLAGNLIRETNTGVMQQLLLAVGAKEAGPCTIPNPAPVGSACLGAFHHEVVQFPNGGIGLLADIEKIFPPGMYGDSFGLPVDVLGDMIIVLDSNWQPVWYWDSFEHAGGGNQLDINRKAVLGETCGVIGACPVTLLTGPGISPNVYDWLHGDSLYYWATDTWPGGVNNDIVYSSRNQDWVLKIDYNNGKGTGNILWRLGPCGDFTFMNTNNDPWPWFSHQHDVSIANGGKGPMTIMDNGNTRVSSAKTSCTAWPGTGAGNSRGMSLTLDETKLTATPVLGQDLGYFSQDFGSAQLLSSGAYYFFLGEVSLPAPVLRSNFSEEILPTANTVNGTQVLNIQGSEAAIPLPTRGWQMTSFYSPPNP